MGETLEEIIELIICDIFKSIFDNINKSKIDTTKQFNLLVNALKTTSLNDNDINMINIVSGHISLIFGLTETESFEHIFSLLKDEKKYKLNLRLVDLLRKSDIILVKI